MEPTLVQLHCKGRHQALPVKVEVTSTNTLALYVTELITAAKVLLYSLSPKGSTQAYLAT